MYRWQPKKDNNFCKGTIKIRKYIKKKPFIELYVLPAIYPDQNLDKKQATEKLKNDVYLKMKQELES